MSNPYPSNIDYDYEQDFYGWSLRQAELVRQRRFNEIDIEHIAEELDGLAKSEKRELRNRLIVLLMHLLKWQYQPERRGRSWERTIKVQREDVAEVVAENPSLKPLHDSIFFSAYRKAVIEAQHETNLDIDIFPEQCPWALMQVLDDGFWPSDS